jgi:hypothetical protein
MSSFCSQTPWPHGGGAASALLSSRNSASMSSGSTYEASLSDTRCNRVICPMNLSVVAADKKKRRLSGFNMGSISVPQGAEPKVDLEGF